MPRHLRFRIALVVVVIAVSAWYLYPLKSAINLGLDLQGGIHLLLGVEADKHVASQTDRGDHRDRGRARQSAVLERRADRRGRVHLVRAAR
jgi:preprotein translocase subunit SecD